MPPPRKPNKEARPSRVEHVTSEQVARMVAAARKFGRHGLRDATIIRFMFLHGFRVAEVVKLRREQVNLERQNLQVRRVKRGTPATHPLEGDQTRALRELWRKYPKSEYVFTTGFGGPLCERGVFGIVNRAGKLADLGDKIHPHMLRHGCGYDLANSGVDTRSIQGFLGHNNIQHTVLYTALSEERFLNIRKKR